MESNTEEVVTVEEKPIDWDLVLPPVINCKLCDETITSGIEYPGRNYYICYECLKTLDVPEDIPENFIDFQNEDGVIDSKYVDTIYAPRTSETGIFDVVIHLKKTLKKRCKNHSFQRCEDCPDEKYKLKLPLTGEEYRHIHLLVLKKRIIRVETLRNYNDVQIIKGGDIIPVRKGVVIKVDESFVDPRDDLETEYDEQWKPVYEDLKRKFPSDVREFRKKIVTDTNLEDRYSFYNDLKQEKNN